MVFERIPRIDLEGEYFVVPVLYGISRSGNKPPCCQIETDGSGLKKDKKSLSYCDKGCHIIETEIMGYDQMGKHWVPGGVKEVTPKIRIWEIRDRKE